MRDQRLAYSCVRAPGAESLPFHVPTGTVVQVNELPATLVKYVHYPCLWGPSGDPIGNL